MKRHGLYLGAALLLISVVVVAAVSGGHVTAEATPKIKCFCEYGYAESLDLSAEGGVWLQWWGQHPVEALDCPCSPSNSLLNKNVVGTLTTWHAGNTLLDPETMIATIPLEGELELACEAGTIIADIAGNFVVDGLAAHALVDEENGVISVAFGRATGLETDPMTVVVTDTTGKYKNIVQDGVWEFYVAGWIDLVRNPALDLQTNILAALQIPDLIIGGHEDILLTGAYYRSAPGKEE